MSKTATRLMTVSMGQISKIWDWIQELNYRFSKEKQIKSALWLEPRLASGSAQHANKPPFRQNGRIGHQEHPFLV